MLKHHVWAYCAPAVVVGRTAGIICESVSDWCRIMRDCPSMLTLLFFLVYIFKCFITLCRLYAYLSSFVYFSHAHVVILYSCEPEFMSKGFSLPTRLRSDAPKDFITPVTHYAALPMQPSRRHFVIEMAIQLHLSIFSRQFSHSA